MQSIDSILLASGGMDSTVMAYWLRNKGIDFIPVFINYNQHCMNKEFETLKELLPQEASNRVKILDLSSIYQNSSSRLICEADLWTDKVVADDLYVPYRNLLFLTAAAAYAQSINVSKIYSAFINSNHAKEIDCSVDFFNSVCKIVYDYGTISIETPFRHMSKSEVARLGIELGAPIANTYSCQANSKNHCGVCPNCVDRLIALSTLFEGRENF